MADAAKSARGAFSDIKNGAAGMGRDTSVNMMEARHGIMLLGEEFGIRMPRAISSFLASIGPVGAAMQAAFPFLAIISLAVLLVEHLKKVKEEGEKLSESEAKFITTTSTVFSNLQERILQAGIKADELSGNHLAVLKKQLELIDRASLKNLVQELETVAKAADNVFGPLQAHWYNFGSGSRGAQHALKEFKDEYESLLAQGKDKEASGLLSGTLKQAERILELQKQAAANAKSTNLAGFDQSGDYAKYVQAYQELVKVGVGYTEKEIQAQEVLVKTLQAQVGVEGRIAEIRQLEGKNTTASVMKDIAAETKKANEQLDKAFETLNKIALINNRKNGLAGALAPSIADADPTGQLRELQGIGLITSQIQAKVPIYAGSSAAMTLEKIKTDAGAAVSQTQKIKEAIATVNEKYAEQKAILDELHRQGQLNDEEYDKALKNTRKQLGLVNNDWKEFAQNSMKTIEAALAFGGSWSGALKSITAQFVELILKATIFKNLTQSMGGGGGKSGGGFLSSLFSGFFADGGHIPAGHWGIAGENGPEPVYGGMSGVTVYPTAQAAGAGSTVNVNFAIDARGADPSVLNRLPGRLEAFKKEVVAASVAAVNDRRRRNV